MSKAELLALQRKWDAKLAKSGFVDAEKRLTTGETELKSFHASTMRKRLRYAPGGGVVAQTTGNKRVQFRYLEYQNTVDYYIEATHYLRSIKSKLPKARAIWRLHCAGLPPSAIGKKLGCNTETVKYRIRAIQKQFHAWRLKCAARS